MRLIKITFTCRKQKCLQFLFIKRLCKAKEKYQGVFEIQKSGDKTSSGEIGLDIRTHAGPKVGQDQVSRRSKRPLSACHTRCKCPLETYIQ